MNETVEHLKMIQGVINRMTHVSFLLKGWSITLVVALLAVAANAQNWWYGLIALIPGGVFWSLDAYYLRQERLFRCLYERVRLGPTESGIPTFSMDTAPYERDVHSWNSTLRAPTIRWFHVVVVILVVIVSIIIYFQ